MKRLLLLLAIAAVIAGSTHAQESTRTEAIREHNERIRKIIEESQRRRQNQAQNLAADAGKAAAVHPPGSKITSGTENAEPAQGLDDEELLIQEANWDKLKDFYYMQQLEYKEFKGENQNYQDDSLQLSWNLGAKKGSVQYQWLHPTTSSETFTSMTTTGADNILLRHGRECAMLLAFTDGREFKITRWQQPEVIYTAGEMNIQTRQKPVIYTKVTSPYIMVQKDYPQIVNDWEFRASNDGELVAVQNGTTETIRIGSNFNDHRPVGNMTVRIYRADLRTGAFVFQVHNGGPQDTLYAATSTQDFLKAASAANNEPTIAAALSDLGNHYKFQVEYANEETQKLANAVEFKSPSISSSESLLLTELEKSFGTNFIPEIVDANTLRLHVAKQYMAQIVERPAMLSQLKADYKLEMRVYVLKRMLAKTAELLIQGKLGTYLVMPKQALSNDAPAEVLHSGSYYAIVKIPLGLDNPKGSASPVPMVSERGIADELSGSLIVTATPETHDQVAALLNKIDAGTKESALSVDQPVPARQRLQVVLLQGGKAGTATTVAVNNASTSVTFDAALPASYGMTPEDLKMLGFDGAVELGRSLVQVISDPSELGESRLTLGGSYSVNLSYRDQRKPYLVIDAKLEGDGGDVLAENTMMLEKDKPGFLGVTNLSGAIILSVTWLGEEAQ